MIGTNWFIGFDTASLQFHAITRSCEITPHVLINSERKRSFSQTDGVIDKRAEASVRFYVCGERVSEITTTRHANVLKYD